MPPPPFYCLQVTCGPSSESSGSVLSPSSSTSSSQFPWWWVVVGVSPIFCGAAAWVFIVARRRRRKAKREGPDGIPAAAVTGPEEVTLPDSLEAHSRESQTLRQWSSNPLAIPAGSAGMDALPPDGGEGEGHPGNEEAGHVGAYHESTAAAGVDCRGRTPPVLWPTLRESNRDGSGSGINRISCPVSPGGVRRHLLGEPQPRMVVAAPFEQAAPIDFGELSSPTASACSLSSSAMPGQTNLSLISKLPVACLGSLEPSASVLSSVVQPVINGAAVGGGSHPSLAALPSQQAVLYGDDRGDEAVAMPVGRWGRASTGLGEAPVASIASVLQLRHGGSGPRASGADSDALGMRVAAIVAMLKDTGRPAEGPTDEGSGRTSIWTAMRTSVFGARLSMPGGRSDGPSAVSARAGFADTAVRLALPSLHGVENSRARSAFTSRDGGDTASARQALESDMAGRPGAASAIGGLTDILIRLAAPSPPLRSCLSGGRLASSKQLKASHSLNDVSSGRLSSLRASRGSPGRVHAAATNERSGFTSTAAADFAALDWGSPQHRHVANVVYRHSTGGSGGAKGGSQDFTGSSLRAAPAAARIGAWEEAGHSCSGDLSGITKAGWSVGSPSASRLAQRSGFLGDPGASQRAPYVPASTSRLAGPRSGKYTTVPLCGPLGAPPASSAADDDSNGSQRYHRNPPAFLAAERQPGVPWAGAVDTAPRKASRATPAWLSKFGDSAVVGVRRGERDDDDLPAPRWSLPGDCRRSDPPSDDDALRRRSDAIVAMIQDTRRSASRPTSESGAAQGPSPPAGISSAGSTGGAPFGLTETAMVGRHRRAMMSLLSQPMRMSSPGRLINGGPE